MRQNQIIRASVAFTAAVVIGALGATAVIGQGSAHGQDAGSEARTEAEAQQAEAQAAEQTPAISEFDELSYTLGYVISHRLGEVDLDVAAFTDGFKTARSDEPLKVSRERMQQILDAFTEAKAARVPDRVEDEAGDDEGEGEPEATADDEQMTADKRAAERKRRAMAEQMDQRPMGVDRPGASYLRIDGQVPSGRVEGAVPATQRVTREADAPDAHDY